MHSIIELLIVLTVILLCFCELKLKLIKKDSPFKPGSLIHLLFHHKLCSSDWQMLKKYQRYDNLHDSHFFNLIYHCAYTV
jgi:hypothetical protein